MKAKAFTLVELLVVIAIIALLMAILMPALQRARMQAKHIICKTNLKSYGLVMILYTDDNDGRLSESYWALYSLPTIQDARNRAGRWDASVPPELGIKPDGTYIPYLKKNVKSSICPVFADAYHQKHSDRMKPDFTYSFNWWLNSDIPIIPNINMVKASETFFAGEEGVWKMKDGTVIINTSIFNDNSLCTRYPAPTLTELKKLNADDFPPYTDAFGEYHRIPMRKIYSALANGQLTGGVSDVVLVDGSVTEVTPYDTFRYAIGIK